MSILVHGGGSISCLLSSRSVRYLPTAISRDSSIRYNYAVSTSLFVLKYVLCVFQFGSRHTTLASVRPQCSLKLFIQKDTSSCPWVCHLAFFAPSSLSPAKGAILPRKVFGLTHSVCSISDMMSMLVSLEMTRASCCPTLSQPLTGGLNLSSSPSVSFPDCACSSPSCRMTRRMSLIGCDFGAAHSWYPYLCYRLLSRESVGHILASRTTATFGAEQNIPVTAHPCLLTSFWYSSYQPFLTMPPWFCSV